MGMESNDLAERAFAQAAVLNIVVQGIMRTLTQDQIAEVRTYLLLAQDHQAAQLLAARVPDTVPPLFAELAGQMDQALRALLLPPLAPGQKPSTKGQTDA
ncbi:hypothetical protein D9M72_85920 [compost metagenome]